MKQQVPDDRIILRLADLTDQYQFPPSLAHSDLRPDLVAYSELNRTASSLSVLRQTTDAKQRKESKDSELAEEVEGNDFVVNLIMCTMDPPATSKSRPDNTTTPHHVTVSMVYPTVCTALDILV